MLSLGSGLFMCLLGFCAAFPTEFDYDCTGLPEGFIYWWACGAYGVCRGGSYSQVDCLNGTSYDRNFRDCVLNTQNPSFPCNGAATQECLAYNGPGHRYPEQQADPVENLPACSFYYTCSYGRYLGHQKCNEGTVYDESTQQCQVPSQVLPPCGTATNDGTAFRSDGFPFRVNGVQQVQPQMDQFGNTDFNQWPFTNEANNAGRVRINNGFRNRFIQSDFNNFANAAANDEQEMSHK